MAAISTIFFDLDSVCLSNGWDREQRRVITDRYQIDYESFDRRHRQVVDTLERGQPTLHEYLQWIPVMCNPTPLPFPLPPCKRFACYNVATSHQPSS